MQGCFKLGNRIYCVHVPIVRFPRIPIDIPIEAGKPDPTPWLQGSDISEDAVFDLSVLAGIERLAGMAKTPGLREKLDGALKEFVSVLDLPAELNIKTTLADASEISPAARSAKS